MKKMLILFMCVVLLLASAFSVNAYSRNKEKEHLIMMLEALAENPDSIYWDVLFIKRDYGSDALNSLGDFANTLARGGTNEEGVDLAIADLKNGKGDMIYVLYHESTKTSEALVMDLIHETLENSQKLSVESGDIALSIAEETIKNGGNIYVGTADALINYSITSLISKYNKDSTISSVVKSVKKNGGLTTEEINLLSKERLEASGVFETLYFLTNGNQSTAYKNIVKTKLLDGINAEIKDIKVVDKDSWWVFKWESISLKPNNTEAILLYLPSGEFVQSNPLLLMSSSDSSIAEVIYVNGEPKVHAKGVKGDKATITVMKFGTTQTYDFTVYIK
ncbi:MAG: hypothetical protein K9L62_16890 [Vallitaleaceae bacterium]|nr:hypothetical protein [Vallitaleaceae bacterium]